jgi:hypothetical protein
MSMYGTRGSIVFLNMFERRRRRGRGSGRRRTRSSCRELAAWLAAPAPPYVFARGSLPPSFLLPKNPLSHASQTP